MLHLYSLQGPVPMPSSMPFHLALKLQLLPPPLHFWLLRKLNYSLAIAYCNLLRIHHVKNYWNESKSNVNHIKYFSACKKEYIFMRHLYQLYWEIWYIYLLQMKIHERTAQRLITSKSWAPKTTKTSSGKKSDQNLWLLPTRKSALGQKFGDHTQNKLMSSIRI